MANVLFYYTSVHDAGCECCTVRVVEYELYDESGNVLDCDDSGPVVRDAQELKDRFSYLAKQYGEFEAHPDNVYL